MDLIAYILSLVISGLIVGALGRLLVPGPNPMSILTTIAVGVLGALVGGLIAAARRGARTRGKSDPIDALAAARAALREPGLPVAQLEGAEREVRLLVDYREDLVADRTRAQNRLRWHLHELEPGWELPAGGLDRAVWLDAVTARLAAHQGIVAELAGELVARCRELTARSTSWSGSWRSWWPRGRRAYWD